MKKLALLALLCSAPCWGASVPINIPNETLSDADAICTVVRLRHRLPATLTRPQCAQVIFNDAFRAYKLAATKQSAREDAQTAEDNTIRTAMNAFDALVTLPIPQAFCGDNINSPEFGEQCDDGNSVGGDGCSDTCRLEVCGNETIDPGEQCDDGNTTPGDGCDANCQTE